MKMIKNIGRVGAVVVITTVSAVAQSTPTVADAQTAMSTGVTTAGVLAGAAAGLFATLWVYGKVQKAGNKASR